MTKKKNITGIILAGGKSSRMGSDKGLLQLNGKTFIEHVIDAMKPLVNNIIIVSDNTAHNKFGHERIADVMKNAGPLAGLYTGLNHSKTEHNLVLSCDIPLISTSILKQLIETDYQNYDVVQIESEGKTMPLIAVYKKYCMHTCWELLQIGERRLRFAVSQLNTKSVPIDQKWSAQVKNVNTKEDLKEINHAIEH